MILTKLLGELLCDLGYVTKKDLKKAVKKQKKLIEEKNLPGRVPRTSLVSKARSEVDEAPVLGKIMVQMGCLRKEELENALKEQDKMLESYKTLESKKLGSVLEECYIINSTLNIAEVLNRIMNYANKVTGSEASTLMLLNDATGELVFSVPTGEKSEELMDVRIPPGKGVAGWVVENDKHVLIHDVKNDPRFYNSVDNQSGFETKSILCVPLKAKSKMIGVLEVINKADGTAFTDEDAMFLKIFANQAAMAIENARYNEELTKHMEYLEEIVKERTADLGKANEELKREIEEKKRAEKEIIKAKNEAEAADQAKTIFLANMSHELRTPLNAIIGYSNLMKLDEKIDKSNQKTLGTIEKCGNDLLDMINDILDISKIEANRIELNPVNFNLIALIEHLANLFGLKCNQKGLKLKVSLFTNDDKVLVYGDAKMLRQVLINLLANAVKFTTKGYVKLSVEKKGDDDYLFSVFDTGAGIELGAQGFIFEPFRQADQGKHHGGTGLGLSISTKQVEIMGGDLQVHSDIGKGACFFFTITLKQGKEGNIAGFYKQNTAPGKKDGFDGPLLKQPCLSAVVADKDKADRETLSNILSKAGIKSEKTGNKKDIIKKIRKTKPSVAFIDYKMLAPDGIEPVKSIKDEFEGNTKTVIVTDSAAEPETENAINSDCDGIVSKPLISENIYDCLSDLFDGEDDDKNEEEGILKSADSDTEPETKIVTDSAGDDGKPLEAEMIYESLSELLDNDEKEETLKSGNATEFDNNLISQMIEDAKFNRITEIETHINTIEKKGSGNAKFISKIRECLESYDMEGILNVLKGL